MSEIILSGVAFELPLGTLVSEIPFSESYSQYHLASPTNGMPFYFERRDSGFTSSYSGDVNIQATRSGNLVTFSGDFFATITVINGAAIGYEAERRNFFKTAFDTKYESLHPTTTAPEPPSEPEQTIEEIIDSIINRTPGASEEEAPTTASGEVFPSETAQSDFYILKSPTAFGASTADRITNFDPESQVIQIDASSFDGAGRRFKVARNSKKAKKLLKKNVDFIYDMQVGFFYYNENGRGPGYGEGGIFAMLDGNSRLDSIQIELI